MTINPISDAQFDAVMAKAGVDVSDGSRPSLTTLTVGAIAAAVKGAGLELPLGLITQAHAALLSGKHLLLTGAPGTGKTEFAVALAAAATSAGIIAGDLQTTGSSDWSPADTVGSYRMGISGELEFSAGSFLQTFDSYRWLIIDELNRADIDKAIGPLFTVLSGQSTILRYHDTSAAGTGQVAVVPVERPVPAGTRPYIVFKDWRLVATMNTDDQDLLYEMSHAFSRRFAQLELTPPTTSKHKALLLARHGIGDPTWDDRVARLAELPGTALGPAITLDAARYVATRHVNDAAATAQDVFREAVRLIVEPQLGYLASVKRAEVLAHLLRDKVVAGGSTDADGDEAEVDDGDEVGGTSATSQPDPLATPDPS